MTKEQERARAKRRYARQQAAASARAVERRRNGQVAVIVAVVLGIVGAFILLSRELRDDTPPAATSSASSGSSASQTASATPSLAAGCTTPPAAPGTEGKLSLPEAGDIAAVTGKSVVATIKTTCGPIELTLDGAKAPTTVASFVQLAQLGYWKEAPCHRLTTQGIFVLQCGDPTGTGSGNPGYGYGIENAPADGKYPRGTVAMARTTDPQSNGGQYFIVYQDSELPTDGGGYSIFGTVTSGMDIVDRIAAGGVGADRVAPKFPISTLVVTTETKD